MKSGEQGTHKRVVEGITSIRSLPVSHREKTIHSIDHSATLKGQRKEPLATPSEKVPACQPENQQPSLLV